MLNYDLEPASSVPLYEQLCRAIRLDIHRGALPSGTRLPSRRSLAAGLGVSVITVDGAYGQLLSEGYLRAEPRRGYFVCEGFEEAAPPDKTIPIEEDPKSLPLWGRWREAPEEADGAASPTKPQ